MPHYSTLLFIVNTYHLYSFSISNILWQEKKKGSRIYKDLETQVWNRSHFLWNGQKNWLRFEFSIDMIAHFHCFQLMNEFLVSWSLFSNFFSLFNCSTQSKIHWLTEYMSSIQCHSWTLLHLIIIITIIILFFFFLKPEWRHTR